MPRQTAAAMREPQEVLERERPCDPQNYPKSSCDAMPGCERLQIRQFVGQGLKTLVPRVMGQTAEAEKKKGGSPRRKEKWNEPKFFDELVRRRGEADARVARAILDWGTKNLTRIWWGEGAKDGSFFPMEGPERDGIFTVSVWTYGKVEVQFQWMTRPPFDDETKRLELRNRLNEIPGVNIPVDGINRRPGIPLSVLAKDDALARFLAVLDWYVEEVKRA